MVALRKTSQNQTKISQLDAFDPNGLLANRGLRDVAQMLGWQRTAHTFKGKPYLGWAYDLIDPSGDVVGQRWRKDGNGKGGAPKYLWHYDKPDNDHADFYLLPGAKRAIAEANGVCYLANGEMGLLAYRAGGIKNAICTTHAEMVNIKDSWIAYLQAIGVDTLVNICDSDDAGRKSAVKWRDALIGTGIAYQAKQWDSALGDKADSNDLWIHTQFDVSAFQQAVFNAEALILPKEKLQPNHHQHNDYASDGEYWRNFSELVNLVGEALGCDGRTTADGWTRKQILCLFHDDHKPSAGFNYETGVLNCFFCGGHSIKETADAVNVDWKPYVKPRKAPQRPQRVKDLDAVPDTSEEDKQAFHEAMKALPADYDPVLEEIKMLQIAFEAGEYVAWMKRDHYAMLSALLHIFPNGNHIIAFGRLNHAFRNGVLNWTCFNAKEAQAVTKMSRSITNETLKILHQIGFVRVLGAYSIYTISNTMGAKVIQNPSTGGRPPEWYRVEANQDSIHISLLSALKRKFIQQYFKNLFAKRSVSMINDMMEHIIEYEDFAIWQSTNEFLDDESHPDYHEHLEASQSLWKEFHGDGHNWGGWKRALASDATLHIQWDSVHSVKVLRARILREWVSNYRPANTNDELERLLGCTEGTIRNLRGYVGADVVERTQRVEAPYTSLSAQVKEACKQHRGYPKWVGVKVDGKPSKQAWERVYDYEKYDPTYNGDRAITDISILMQIPNWYEAIPVNRWHLMLLGKMRFFYALIAGILRDLQANAETYGIDAETIEELSAQVEIKQVTDSAESNEPDIADDEPVKVIHVWQGYTPDWLDRQNALDAHLHTDEILLADGRTLVNRHTWQGFTYESRDDLILALNDLRGDKALRSSADWVTEQKAIKSLRKMVATYLTRIPRRIMTELDPSHYNTMKPIKVAKRLAEILVHLDTGYIVFDVNAGGILSHIQEPKPKAETMPDNKPEQDNNRPWGAKPTPPAPEGEVIEFTLKRGNEMVKILCRKKSGAKRSAFEFSDSWLALEGKWYEKWAHDNGYELVS